MSEITLCMTAIGTAIKLDEYTIHKDVDIPSYGNGCRITKSKNSFYFHYLRETFFTNFKQKNLRCYITFPFPAHLFRWKLPSWDLLESAKRPLFNNLCVTSLQTNTFPQERSRCIIPPWSSTIICTRSVSLSYLISIYSDIYVTHFPWRDQLIYFIACKQTTINMSPQQVHHF